MAIRFRTSIFALILAVAFAGIAGAQSKKQKDKEEANTRTVQGMVTDDSDAPIASAVVQLKDTRTLQIRSYITRDDGSYRFSGLKNDTDYQLKADSNGQSSGWRTLSVFDTRPEPIMNLKIEKK